MSAVRTDAARARDTRSSCTHTHTVQSAKFKHTTAAVAWPPLAGPLGPRRSQLSALAALLGLASLLPHVHTPRTPPHALVTRHASLPQAPRLAPPRLDLTWAQSKAR